MKTPKPAQPEVTAEAYREAVEFMDNMSQYGFGQISAIAKLALQSLETPEGYRSLDDIAQALSAIWAKAEDMQNQINYSAEQVGCNHVDAAERRRHDALRVARERGIAA